MLFGLIGCKRSSPSPASPAFQFWVQDVFYIKPPVDRVILVGVVEDGTIPTGASALVHTATGDISVTIENIETIKEGAIKQAIKGQQVGLKLSGIRKDQVQPNDLVLATSPGTAMPKPASTKPTSFELARGIQVADLTGIHEGYEESKTPQGYWVVRINVSAQNIPRVFTRLAKEVDNPGFLLLEVGTHRDEEAKLRKQPTDPFHKDVYYLDGLTTPQALAIFETYHELLVHDGGVNVGFGSHRGKDEVFIGAYKIFEVYADHPDKYRKALQDLGFTPEPKLKTVWDTFTQTSPGKRQVLKGVPKTIWDMVEELKAKGLYLAERRED